MKEKKPICRRAKRKKKERGVGQKRESRGETNKNLPPIVLRG